MRESAVDRRLPLFQPQFVRISMEHADGLIVRKAPEFVKKNCLASGKFQRLVKHEASVCSGGKTGERFFASLRMTIKSWGVEDRQVQTHT